MEREKLSSRLGFILLSAGCAIGIGNVWRFPYITGQNGGGIFVLIYLFFLIVMGLPILTMEFAVGRASRQSAMGACATLSQSKLKWRSNRVIAFAGNYLLMMFYTTVAGWMLYYFYQTAAGAFEGKNTEQISQLFSQMTGNPWVMTVCMLIVVVCGFLICSIGLKNGVEKITKWMMVALLGIMVVLAIRSITLPGASEGLSFYLMPSIEKVQTVGIGNVVVQAMNQSFFTLSLGIGAMAIFGSYLGKERRLLGESVNIAVLDTFVAVVSGLIIFPACFAYGVNPDSGPKLIFITLPNIFNHMPGGRIWGSLFFIFMLFAALSTIIAVFENISAFSMELFGWSRKKATLINGFVIALLSMPCVLGFNLLAGFEPLKAGNTIMDLEDFLVSNLALPIGSLVYILFCTSKLGWGWKNFRQEANIGKGLKVPNWLRIYCTFILPLIVVVILVYGLITYFM